jgi:hypothetical protein
MGKVAIEVVASISSTITDSELSNLVKYLTTRPCIYFWPVNINKKK